MQEDKQDGQRTDILHQEDIEMEITSTQRPPVGKLIVYQLMGSRPSDEDTGEESHDGQEYLAGDEVEPVEQRLAKQLQTGTHSP